MASFRIGGRTEELVEGFDDMGGSCRTVEVAKNVEFYNRLEVVEPGSKHS